MHVLAVSKGQPLHKIEALYAQGQRDFGENYANEMNTKMDALAEKCPEIRWHFIGQIQSNKIKQIARAHVVQSVSKIKQIDALALATPHEHLGVFIQVSLDGDTTRGGALPEDIPRLQEAILKQPKLKLLGLMAITPHSESSLQAERSNPPWIAASASPPRNDDGRWFTQMRALRLPGYPELSMGMSDDYEEAIKHGATWVRLGTALFGLRKNKAEGYPEKLYNPNLYSTHSNGLIPEPKSSAK